MLIEIENLTKRGEAFAHDYTPAELPLDEEELRLLEDARVRGIASRAGERIRLRGEIKTKIEKPCDRCLTSLALAVEVGFDEKFVSSATEAERETPELGAEDLTVSVIEEDAINLDEVVREQILLAVSSRSLCRDDCRGLCPNCGANLNEETCACETADIDPRWAALKRWSQ